MGCIKLSQIACVTGASGMIGAQIVHRLLKMGYRVRVLSRKKLFNDKRIKVFKGGLEQEETLKSFLKNASVLFHCAGELRDRSKMWDVNVLGTRRLLRIAETSDIKYLCHLSSAGVTGRTKNGLVSENTKGGPQNLYERCKYAAEKAVMEGFKGCTIVILRPTNVVDERRPGALSPLIHPTFLNFLLLFIKGGECAHIIHAENVADAAIFFLKQSFSSPRVFFVSLDHEKFNTFAGLWALRRTIKKGTTTDDLKVFPHLPWIVPHALRKLLGKATIRGDVRYSSDRLISEGFKYRIDTVQTVRRIVLYNSRQPDD